MIFSRRISRVALSIGIGALSIVPFLSPRSATANAGGLREFYADTFADPLDYSNPEDVALVDEALIVGVDEKPTLSDGQLHLNFGGLGYFSPLWGGYDVGGHKDGSDAVGQGREGNARRLDGRKYKTFRVKMNVSGAVGGGIFFYTCVAGVKDACQSGIQFVTEPGWKIYQANVPAEWVTGIRVAISGDVNVDVDWVQVLSEEPGNTTLDNNLTGPIPEVLNPDAAGAVPMLFPLGGKPIPYQGTNCANNDWATRVRGDAWDFDKAADIEKIENYLRTDVTGGQFNGVGSFATKPGLPGDPGIRLALSGKTINPQVWHRATTIVPFWDGRYSQEFKDDGGWVLRYIWKFAGKEHDKKVQLAAPVVEYPNDTTLSVDLNDPSPFDGSAPPQLNINDVTAPNQLGWSRPNLRVLWFRIDLSEPYKERQTPLDQVWLSTNDCGVKDADIVFRDNNPAPGTEAEIFASQSPLGPWQPIGKTAVQSGLNTFTWSNAPKGTWWVSVRMARSGQYGENMSTGPVTIGTDFSAEIAADRGTSATPGTSATSRTAPNELGLSACTATKTVKASTGPKRPVKCKK